LNTNTGTLVLWSLYQIPQQLLYIQKTNHFNTRIAINVRQAREVFNIPEDFEAGIMIAIGYQDVHQVLPESLRQKARLPRERKPLSEIAFSEELGNGII
jgi:hypothetical protein